MHSRYVGMALLLAGLLCACGSNASQSADPPTGPSGDPPGGPPGNPPGDPGTPPGSGGLTRTVADPAGDTFGNRGVQWDMTGLTITRDSAGITVELAFTAPLISPTSGDSNAMIAFVDLDTDQDSATGATPTVDEFRRDGASTGMGADYQLVLANYEADSTVAIFDAAATVTGRVRPVFDGNKVSVRIPRALLGDDDGYLNAAAIAGTQASPTDIVPEQGHLEVSETPSQP